MRKIIEYDISELNQISYSINEDSIVTQAMLRNFVWVLCRICVSMLKRELKRLA